MQKNSKMKETANHRFHVVKLMFKFTLTGESSLTKLRPKLRSATIGEKLVEYRRFSESMDSNLAKHLACLCRS